MSGGPSDGGSPLPPLYAGWAAEILDDALPPEPHATCDSCVMIAPKGTVNVADKSAIWFDASTKCCTYQPALPSFLAGRILKDASLEARLAGDVIRARIAAREAVTPLGVDVPADRRDRYLRATKEGTFGRTPELKCPHFRAGDGANCGIWLHRNATCATWFCKHGRGALGADVWKRLRDLFALVEARLARWCALELSLPAAAFARLIVSPDAAGERTTEEARDREGHYRAVWSTWLGREVEYFERCAGIVERLRWSDVEAICGADAALNVALVRHALAKHEAEAPIPRDLRLGRIDVESNANDGTVLIRGYSEYDPITLPRDLLTVLESVQGRPTELALAELRGRGIVLDAELLRLLVTYEVLLEDGA